MIHDDLVMNTDSDVDDMIGVIVSLQYTPDNLYHGILSENLLLKQLGINFPSLNHVLSLYFNASKYAPERKLKKASDARLLTDRNHEIWYHGFLL